MPGIDHKMTRGKPSTADLSGANGGGGKNGSAKQKNPNDTPFVTKGYCWSHEFRVHFGHNSSTCKWKRDGHIDCATRDNNMGGFQKQNNWV